MTSVLLNKRLGIDHYMVCLADNACDETNHHAAVADAHRGRAAGEIE
jgi:hypothetical protein